jgi:hypothetical protein
MPPLDAPEAYTRSGSTSIVCTVRSINASIKATSFQSEYPGSDRATSARQSFQLRLRPSRSWGRPSGKINKAPSPLAATARFQAPSLSSLIALLALRDPPCSTRIKGRFDADFTVPTTRYSRTQPSIVMVCRTSGCGESVATQGLASVPASVNSAAAEAESIRDTDVLGMQVRLGTATGTVVALLSP